MARVSPRARSKRTECSTRCKSHLPLNFKAPAHCWGFCVVDSYPKISIVVENSGRADMINLSFSEATALATKAARGVGYSWGEAEDAAFATTALCKYGLDGLSHLLRTLQNAQNNPLLIGIQIQDFAKLDRGPIAQKTVFSAVLEPVFTLPFVARAAQILGKPLCVVVNGDPIFVDAAGHIGSDDITTIARLSQADIMVQIANDPVSIHPHIPKTRVYTTQETLDALTRFAHETYVPATEASRLSGAGAGVADND